MATRAGVEPAWNEMICMEFSRKHSGFGHTCHSSFIIELQDKCINFGETVMQYFSWNTQKRAPLFFSIILALLLVPFALEAMMKEKNVATLKEETEFTFAGNCFNGPKYWLHASEELIDGVSTPTYNYKGPVGEGTVHTDTSPKVMAQRVCRANADIVSNF